MGELPSGQEWPHTELHLRASYWEDKPATVSCPYSAKLQAMERWAQLRVYKVGRTPQRKGTQTRGLISTSNASKHCSKKAISDKGSSKSASTTCKSSSIDRRQVGAERSKANRLATCTCAGKDWTWTGSSWSGQIIGTVRKTKTHHTIYVEKSSERKGRVREIHATFLNVLFVVDVKYDN